MIWNFLVKSNDLLNGYGPKQGFEGPFIVGANVLYYDTKEKKYWDPKTDMYVRNDEYFRMAGLI
jgi:hypothetical protein